MKSILNPSFKYTPSSQTDLRKTFARVRKLMQQQSENRSEQKVSPLNRAEVKRLAGVKS